MKRPARWVWLALIISVLSVSVALAQPGQVLIIRHAEPPADRGPFNLSLKGQERAMAYVPFFTHTPELIYCGLPVALFVTKIGPGDFSQSALETLTPLSNHLRVLIDAHYDKRDYAALAQDVLTNPKYHRKTVLICWDRKYIPKLAAALGVFPPPPAWPQHVFDRVWRITYRRGQASLVNMPQRLLFGDAAK
jgi:hypothetical protein